MSTKLSFSTILIQAGKTATGIVIPDDIVMQLGAGKKPPVLVTINGYTYRNTIAVMGGQYCVGVSAEHRAGAQVKAGDLLQVSLELDTQPRVLEIPEAVIQTLGAFPLAKAAFEKLSYSNQQRLIIPYQKAKSEEAKQRNLDKILDTLLVGTSFK